ncbi:MAG: hypothetical protein ABSH46_01910 [Bryobacteraceae bacterium]|jgi:hypothetical protein
MSRFAGNAAVLGPVPGGAAIVPAGANGAISIFVIKQTRVILDINGYLAP